MKIRLIEPFAVRLPMVKPMKMAGEEVRAADNVLVRITSDSGVIGWGEAASAPAMTGETADSMLAAVRYLARFLVGMEAGDFDATGREMDWRMYGNHAAKAGIEMALLDLVGRATGHPVHELLGPKQRGRVPVLWLIGTGSLEGDVAEARIKKALGVTAYKIKIGTGDPLSDAHRTIAIREALGPGMLVSADANQGYGVEAAIRYVRAVEHCAIDFVEQPVAGDDLQGMSRVAAASRIAIGADEGIHSLSDIERHRGAGAAQGVSLKTIKLGGLRAVYRAGNLCERLGMHTNLACKIAESSIASAALLHAAAVLPRLQWGVSLSSQYLARDLAHTPISTSGGFADVPKGPGLGIGVDEDAVREFRLGE